MKPVDMLVLNDPENGKVGDCFRACLASLLEVSAEEVPHFLHDDCSIKIFYERIADFLKPRGLKFIELWSYDKEWHPNVEYHTIHGDTTRGTYHAVVGKNGVVVHDPHPSRVGLLPESKSASVWYVFGFIVDIDYEHKRKS